MALTIALRVKLQKNVGIESDQPSINDSIGYKIMKCNSSKMVSDGSQKPPIPRYSPTKATGSSRKVASQSPSRDLQSKLSVSSSSRSVSKVDLSKLDTASLWRYCRSYNLETGPYPSTKEQLVSAVEKHLELQQLDEVQVIPEFVYAARRLKSLSQSAVN